MNGYSKWLLRLCCDAFFHILKANTNPNPNPTHKKSFDDSPKIESSPTTLGSGTGGSTRAGLFRTPISGGVQSATSAHGLPRPALAVRNLMEQVSLYNIIFKK